MCSNHDCSNGPNQLLGLLLCTLVVAYLYYFTTSQLSNNENLEKTQNPVDVSHPESQILESAPQNALTDEAKLLKAFEAGIKAYMQFDIEDIRHIKYEMEERNHESKEREKRMEKKLEEFAKGKVEMDMQMKAWREEQLRMIWDGKQKDERGVSGWFRLRSPRVTESVMRSEEKEVILNDMKKE
jgi:hypothetical protein